MNYQKLTENLFIPTISTPQIIKLSELEEQLNRLKDLSIIEPDDIELIEYAKQNHPFYVMIDNNNQEIIRLEEIINYLKSL
jgi:2-C-methyl-D-erythritol 4-phosphate cytidylyltransferase